jgi:hypothetical protein
VACAAGVVGLAIGGAAVARWVSGAASGASVPASHEVQVAYDDAKATASLSRHVDDLQIREASCKPVTGRRYYCQIDFVQTLAPQGRLFFTVVTIEEVRHRWSLISGLCKSPSV